MHNSQVQQSGERPTFGGENWTDLSVCEVIRDHTGQLEKHSGGELKGKKSYSLKPMLVHPCSFLHGRMASPGGQSTDFLTASDRKACLGPLLKSEVGRWWMYFVMNKFFVGDIRNQKMPLKKNWDGRFGKHWAAFPPWQHWAGEDGVQQLPL